ncbi:MAG: glycosyltransferase family 87 protein [Anaerolineae bacterium]
MKRLQNISFRTWLLVAAVASLALLVAYQIPYTYRLNMGQPEVALFTTGLLPRERQPQYDFRWSTAHATLVLPAVVQNQKYRLELVLAAGARPASAPVPELAVTANGMLLDQAQIDPAADTYTFTVDPAVVARSSNLTVALDVPTFNPSETIPGSTDDRDLGVQVISARLTPDGPPIGLVALPPWTQWLGWTLLLLLYALLLRRTRLLPTRRQEWLGVGVGALLLLLGLTLARSLAASQIWPLCGIMAALALVAPTFLGWVARSRAEGRLSLEFLHTLGIPNPRTRAAVEGVLITAIAIYYLVAVVLPLRSTTLGDFATYYVTGGIYLQGGDFYDADQLQAFNDQHHILPGKIGPLSYPPAAVVMYAPIALLTWSQAKLVWLVLSYAFLVAAAVLLWLALRQSSAQPASPIWLALMLLYSQSLQHSLEFGQVGPLFIFLFAAALWGWTNRRATSTGAAIVIATAFKIFPGIYLAYFLWRRAWRNLIQTIAIGAGVLIATLLVTGPGRWLTYFTAVLPDSSFHRPSNFDQSTLIFLRRINSMLGWLPDNSQLDKTPSIQMQVLALVVSGLLLALTLAVFYRHPARDAQGNQVEFGVALALMMLLLPRMWEHYLMWLILPLYLMLNGLANRQIGLAAQVGVLALFLISLPISQDAPGFFTQPGFPPALTSLGLYGNFLILLGLLYLSAYPAPPLPISQAAPAKAHEAQQAEQSI